MCKRLIPRELAGTEIRISAEYQCADIRFRETDDGKITARLYDIDDGWVGREFEFLDEVESLYLLLEGKVLTIK